MDDRSIGAFDSGLGGLTVLMELKKIMPDESFVFLADTKNRPYGDKTPLELEALVRRDIEILLENDVKIIVFACNTASTLDLESLSEEYKIPMVTVLDATVNDINDEFDKVLVAATQVTVDSNKHRDLINEKFPNIYVESVACPQVAPEIEAGNLGDDKALYIVDSYLGGYEAKDYDALVLGCTHYPIWAPVFKKVLPTANLIDPSQSTAVLTLNYLKNHNMLSSNSCKHTRGDIFYVTGDEKDFAEKAKKILKKDSVKVQKI